MSLLAVGLGVVIGIAVIVAVMNMPWLWWPR